MKRLDKELRHALRARFNALEDAIVAQYVTLPRNARMDCRPRYIDFAFTPECRAIIDVPTAEIITADQFAAVLPILALRWDADRKQELTDYILTHLPNFTPDVDPLELAVAFFACKTRCQPVFATVRYPAILAHRCLLGDCFRLSSCARDEFEQGDVYTRTTNSLTWSAHDAQAYADGAGLLSVRVPFHLAQLAATGEADARQLMNTMRRIVAALGLDPARATFDELQECGTWLRCVTCETADPADWIRARSWRTAVGCPAPSRLPSCEHEMLTACDLSLTLLAVRPREVPHGRRLAGPRARESRVALCGQGRHVQGAGVVAVRTPRPGLLPMVLFALSDVQRGRGPHDTSPE